MWYQDLNNKIRAIGKKVKKKLECRKRIPPKGFEGQIRNKA